MFIRKNQINVKRERTTERKRKHGEERERETGKRAMCVAGLSTSTREVIRIRGKLATSQPHLIEIKLYSTPE